MRIVAFERQPIPGWYDHAVVWWAIIAAQVAAAGAIVRALGMDAGTLRLALVGALVAWSVAVDARYVSYRRAIDTAPAYDQR